MPVFAKLVIGPVPYSAAGIYLPEFSYRLPTGNVAWKLTIVTRSADLAFQVREGDGGFPIDTEFTEQLADRGFTSFTFITPITGFRFRCNEVAKSTLVTFHAFG